MRYILLILLFTISLGANAQVDAGNKSIGIPLPETASPTPSKPKTPLFELPPTIKDPNEKPRGSLVIDKSPISMTPTNEFKNPGKVYEDKLNKRGEGDQYRAQRQNVRLGDFRTSSPYIIVKYRDFGEIDGDKIQLLNNDKIVLQEDYLEGRFKEFRIDLTHGINKIDILALNEGLLFPNTAAYEIYDAYEELLSANSWALSTNFRAFLIIIRE